HEAFRMPPHGLEDARPRVADADVAGLAGAGRYLLAGLVVDHGIDPEHAGAAAAGFHGLQGGQRAAEEAAVLGLPPGVHDDRLTLADHVAVPAPHLRFDRLADGGHVLEPVPVFGGFVGAELAQHPDGGGGGVEDVHAEPFGDAPRPAGV